MADQDIVLRDPGGGVGAISFGGTPPIVGEGAAELPTLAAAAVGQLRLVGVAAVALPALAAAGAGELAVTGTAAADLPTLAADADGALALSGAGAAALPPLEADGDGQQILLGSAAVALPSLGASAAGSLAIVGAAAVTLPSLGVSSSGAHRFVGLGSVSLPVLEVDATGSVPGDEDEPGFITLPRAGALYELALPAVASLYTITLTRPMARLHIGDTALIEGITIRDRDGALVDPTTLTVLVLTPLGVEVELVYGTAPSSGDGDAIARTAEGTFNVQVELTEERGAGNYRYTVVTTGARAAEPGTFTVYARSI